MQAIMQLNLKRKKYVCLLELQEGEGALFLNVDTQVVIQLQTATEWWRDGWMDGWMDSLQRFYFAKFVIYF